MTHNIACCYLTHNHPDVVKRVLGKVLTSYDENGIDIYMYDSSTSDDTKEYIDKLIAGGAKNLFYVPVDAGIGGDGKMLEVLKGHGLQKEYDYIWPNKDRSYVTKATAGLIQAESHKNYQCLYIDTRIPTASVRRDYKPVYGREEFFREFGWLTTSWETMIIHADLLLHTITWDIFEAQYALGGQQNFNQSLTVFGGLALVDDAKVRVLSYREAELRNDFSTSSDWIIATFLLWGERWPKAINSLPACYDADKEKVIKDGNMHPNVFGSVDNLILLEQKGCLNTEVWNRYRAQWDKLSDIPVRYVEAVLARDYGKVMQMAMEDLQAAFAAQDYDLAYYIAVRTYCISNITGNTAYWMLRTCMEVFLNELDAKKTPGIMYHVNCYQDLVDKYQQIKLYLRRIEYDIPVPEDDMLAYLGEHHITSEFICAVIEKECINWTKILDYWRNIGYEG